MNNPALDKVFRFRPSDLPPPPPDDEDGEPVFWEDNWLSNALAYVSQTMMTTWCKTPVHWTSRVMRYLFTDCPCCLVFRGLSLGFMAGLTVGATVAASIAAVSWR